MRVYVKIVALLSGNNAELFERFVFEKVEHTLVGFWATLKRVKVVDAEIKSRVYERVIEPFKDPSLFELLLQSGKSLQEGFGIFVLSGL